MRYVEAVRSNGNVDEISALNSGAPADRRYTLSGLTGTLLVENDSSSYRVYYAWGDATVDCTSIATADGFVPKGAAMLLRGIGDVVSFWAEQDGFKIAIGEVS